MRFWMIAVLALAFLGLSLSAFGDGSTIPHPPPASPFNGDEDPNDPPPSSVPDGWIVTKGSWTWSSNRFTNSGMDDERIFHAIPEALDGSVGYEVRFNGMLTQDGPGWGFYFNAALTPTDNTVTGYSFQYDPGYAPGSYILWEWVNDVPTLMTSANHPQDFGVDHEFILRILPDSFSVSQDGEEVLTYEGPLTMPRDLIGFRTWIYSTASFSNPDVDEITVTPEPTVLSLLAVSIPLLARSLRRRGS